MLLKGVSFWSNKQILQTLIHSYIDGPPWFNQKVLNVKNLTNIMPMNYKISYKISNKTLNNNKRTQKTRMWLIIH